MKVKLLEQRHPSYDGPALCGRRALYAGGKLWHDMVSTWCPQFPQEDAASHAARKARALYTNHAGPIVDVLSASVFAEAPTVDGLTGSWVNAWTANVDREGTPLAEWFAARLTDALIDRTVYAWVNLPARPAGVEIDNRAAEEEAGLLDAFLVAFTAEQVIDWEHDEQGGIAWILVRDVVERRVDVGGPRTRVHRWTYIDRQTVRRWTWTSQEGKPDPADDDEAQEQPPILHRLGELPVARLHLPEGLHAMGKLHDPAVAHLRARNDLSWALHRAAHALLWIKSKWDDKRPVLGPGIYLQLGIEDDIGYAEPSGSNFQLLAEDTVQLREELYRVVQQMAIGADSDATRSKSSGESKSQDWRAMEIVLSALAARLRSFMVDVLRLVAKARGQDASPTVKGLDGWQQEDIEVWLASAAMSIEAHALSPTFRREVAKRQAGRVLQDADEAVLRKVKAEIDAAQVDDPAPYVPPDRRPPEPTGDDEEDDEEED